MNWRLLVSLVGAGLLAGACGKKASAAAPPPAVAPVAAPAAAAPAAGERQWPTRAQPKLRTIKLWLGAEEMTAELAQIGQQLADREAAGEEGCKKNSKR